MSRSRVLWLVCLAALGLAVPPLAGAQAPVQLKSVGVSGSLTANATAVTLSNTGGLASLTVQSSGTYAGTWEVQCATDGPQANWDLDDEVTLTLMGSTTTATAVTDAAGIYQGNISGCTAVRVITTAWTSGTLEISMQAITPGGGSSGGGAGGTFDGVLLDAAAGDAITDTVNNALRVNIIAGAGSGGTAAADESAFTLATTSLTPMGCIEATDTAAAGSVMAVRCGNNRVLDVDVISMPSTTVTATDLDVQSGGADILSTTAFNAALGTAGTADTQVLTVQGIAAMTPLLATVTATNLDVQIGGSDTVAVSNAGLTDLAAAINSNLVDVNIVSGAGSGGTALADDADFTAGTTSFTPMGGFYQSTVTACTDGDTCAAGITTQRTLKTTLFSAAGAELTPSLDMTVGTAFSTTAPGTLFSYKEFDGAALPTTTNVNTEHEAAPPAVSLQGVQYVMVVNEDGSLERGTATTPLIVGDGTGALNVIIDSSATLTVASHAVTNAGTFATQVDGAALTALQLIDDAQTGDSVHYRTSAGATEDEHEIKATAGRLFSVAFTNTNAAVRYVRCYNLTAANTTPGTSTVFWGLAIPGAATGAGFVHTFGPNGMAFSTALTCAFTTGAADTDVQEVAANEIKATYTYK